MSLHRIIIYIHFPLIYAIWWALTHSARSYFCMNGWQRCAFSFSTHTLKRPWRLNEDTNTWTTSPELLWESLHECFIWVNYPHIIYTQKCKGIHGKPVKIKVRVFFIKSLLLSLHHSACALMSEVGYEVGYETLIRTLQQKYLFSPNVHSTTTKIMKTYFFKEWLHNISNMF